jgi:hypothetical protein
MREVQNTLNTIVMIGMLDNVKEESKASNSLQFACAIEYLLTTINYAGIASVSVPSCLSHDRPVCMYPRCALVRSPTGPLSRSH